MSVIFENESKESLIKGVNLIGDAVATTFGPNGKNVFIKGSTGLHVTKDGATVAKFVSDEDPAVEMGIELVRNIATKTADDVGDGTTTSTILAKEIVNTLKDSSEHPIEISRKLKEDVEKTIEVLAEHRKEITSKEDLIKVATISTNNDPELGNLIGETWHTVGKAGIVLVEEGSDVQTTVEYTGGTSIESGYTSPFFINNESNECELEDVLLYIAPYKLNKPKDISEIAGRAINENKSLVIIAPKSDSSIITALLANSQDGTLKSCLVHAPSHGHWREKVLNDLSNSVGEYCDKVVISLDKTVFIGGTQNKEACDLEVESINKTLANKSLPEFDKVFHSKRLANYTGGMATIYVGGHSAVEVKEKKDRVDDAICAVRAAYHEGVLPGGGIAISKVAQQLQGELNYLQPILFTPYEILRNSANISDLSLGCEFWEDIDLKTKEIKDYYEIGVLDPFLVTKISLENAVSAASLVLTSGCSIF